LFSALKKDILFVEDSYTVSFHHEISIDMYHYLNWFIPSIFSFPP
jgi:hypothetical protein